jgi:hypothetical protein
MNTHNTAVQVHSVSQCAKNQNRTHTRGTRFEPYLLPTVIASQERL